ncbi:hypothetical protein [Afipia broomeae]|uniref:hypothetical protein n=1 Tax=Afipia broomeae TaxID=56946 RepID=UPI0012F9292F|nr:hypothetical protein [Afipia broomeae]
MDTDDPIALFAVAEQHFAALQEIFHRLARERAQPLTEARPDRGLSDLIKPGEAAKLAKCSKSTVNRWCNDNPVDKPGGFAILIRERWHISKAPFLDFLARDPKADPIDETFER